MDQLNKVKQENLPYERFLRFGPESLTESELLAIILRTGTRDKSALELAQEVLALAQPSREGLLGLHDIPLERLKEIKGIGEVKAVKLKCITELSQRIATAVARERVCLQRPDTVAAYYMERLRHRKTEESGSQYHPDPQPSQRRSHAQQGGRPADGGTGGDGTDAGDPAAGPYHYRRQ